MNQTAKTSKPLSVALGRTQRRNIGENIFCLFGFEDVGAERRMLRQIPPLRTSLQIVQPDKVVTGKEEN